MVQRLWFAWKKHHNFLCILFNCNNIECWDLVILVDGIVFFREVQVFFRTIYKHI